MVPNDTLSIPNALKRERARRLLPEHCDDRMAGWRRRPAARHQNRLRGGRGLQGGRARSPGQGVRALPGGRGLARCTISTSPASACCRRSRTLLDQPFWLDPSDPHRMALGDPVPDPPAHLQLLGRLRRSATLGRKRGARLGKGRAPRRRRGHQPRAGGRRGDRPDQADPRASKDHASAAFRLSSPRRSPWRRSAREAADLVVWWEKGFYAQEDEAVAEIVAAFEQKTGKQVELVQPAQDEMFDKAQAALEAGRAARLPVRHRRRRLRSAAVGLRRPAGRP